MSLRPEIIFQDHRCRIVLKRTPTMRDVDRIIETILQSEGTIVVIVEYMDTAVTSYPTIELIWHVYGHLTDHSDEVMSRLLGTAVVTSLDPIMSLPIKDLALAILQPRKPLCVSNDLQEVGAFVSACLMG